MADQSQNQNLVAVSEYTTAIRRALPLILVAGLVGAVLGTILTQFQRGTYETEARVEIRPLLATGDDANLDINRRVNTVNERVIASSQRVTERALALLDAASQAGTDDLDDPDVEAAADTATVDPDLVERVEELIEVSVPTDSQILVFRVQNDEPARARDLANASAHAYLDFRRASGLLTTEESRTQLEEREAALIAELDTLSSQVAAAGENQARLRELGYRELSKRQELQGIGAKLANLNAISVDPGVVLDNADLPENLTGIPTPVGLIGGGILGLLGGVAVAFLMDRGDDRFRDPRSEIESMGVDLLGTVPVGTGLFRRGGEAGIAEVNSDRGEAYRRVQNSLLFQLDQLDKSVVLVAGTNNPQSATTVAANLAVAAARSGRRTLLVGADLRRPSLHDRFNLRNDVGLSDVLSGRAHFNGSLVQTPELPNLWMLFSGARVDQPSRLLQGVGLGRMVDATRDEYDLVIFEAPPVLQVADASDLARLCDGTLLVVEPSRATRSGVADSIDQLRRVGGDVIGTVVAESDNG